VSCGAVAIQKGPDQKDFAPETLTSRFGTEAVRELERRMDGALASGLLPFSRRHSAPSGTCCGVRVGGAAARMAVANGFTNQRS